MHIYVAMIDDIDHILSHDLLASSDLKLESLHMLCRASNDINILSLALLIPDFSELPP